VTEPNARASRSGALDQGTKVALVAMCLGVFLIANDFTEPSSAWSLK
jgi:hypothetical protein